MSDEDEKSFEDRDLSDAEFWGVDLSRAKLRDVNFTGAAMRNVWLVDVDIDGLIDGLVINGVDVTVYVNAHDPWQPLRGMLRPTDRAGLLATWDELDRQWAQTFERAEQLSDAQLHESVNGEWSFVQTLRHLVFATDKWFVVPITGGEFHAVGMPNTGSVDYPWPGIDRSANPSYDEVRALRADIMQQLRSYLEGVTEEEVHRTVDVLENGPHSVIDCLYTVFEEEFEHRRYAIRDLDLLLNPTDG